jgi:hypothetical protein
VKIERVGHDYLESLRHRDLDCLLKICLGRVDEEMKQSVELPALVSQLGKDLKV